MKKKINFRLDESDETKLKQHAEKEGLTFSALIRRIIKEFLERIENGRSDSKIS